jgi:hypothetical protein
MNLDALGLSGTSAGFTSLFLSLIKPYYELIPGFRDGSPLHDPTLRMLNVLVNALTVMAVNYQSGTFSWNNWLNYLVVAISQAVGSQGLYFFLTATSGAAKATKAAATPAPVPQQVKW